MSSKKKAERSSWSLATRLTCWYAVLSFLTVSITTIFLYHALIGSLDQNYDRQLWDDIAGIQLLLDHHQIQELRWEVEEEGSPNKPQESYLRVLDETSGVNLQSPDMAKALPPEFIERFNPTLASNPSGINVLSPDGREFRLMISHVQKNGKRQIIQTAVDRTDDQPLLASFRKKMAIVTIFALVICGFSGFWISRQGIKPIFTIAVTAAKVHSSTLSDRISAEGLPLELLNLADTMNAMLSRLEESFNRLSQFSSDIAHELRTPIHNLRGLVEVVLTSISTSEQSRELLIPCQDECRRLSTMIENLLFLAKTENPQMKIDSCRLNAGQELATMYEYYDAAAAEANIGLSFTSEDDLQFDADRLLLQRALGNLIENALKYTPAGGKILLRAFRKTHSIALEVSDTGCGIPAEHLPLVFDRLYRVEPSRSQTLTSRGSGLGLAIVKGIMSLHCGSVSVSSVPGTGSAFVLEFPAFENSSS